MIELRENRPIFCYVEDSAATGYESLVARINSIFGGQLAENGVVKLDYNAGSPGGSSHVLLQFAAGDVTVTPAFNTLPNPASSYILFRGETPGIYSGAIPNNTVLAVSSIEKIVLRFTA